MLPLRVYVYFLCVETFVSGLNILAIFPHNGKSHFDEFEILLRSLAEKGHKVTVISHFPQSQPLPNYEDISLRTKTSIILKNAVDLKSRPKSRMRLFFKFHELMQKSAAWCKQDLLDQPQLQDFVKSGKKYDVILVEIFVRTCFLGFAHAFKAPLIGISTTQIFSWDQDLIGNPSNPSYVEQVWLPYKNKRLSFFERVENSLLGIIQNVVVQVVRDRPNNYIAKKFFGQDLPDLRQIAANMSIFFSCTHYSLHPTKPNVPAVIEIAGLHIETPKKLPDNIEKWINESTHGVIYFSLGSLIKGHTFPEEKRQMFMKAFARLPQRVLWKWETEMPGKPDNVMTQGWMPQFDILSHSNVKAFISHGGLLGTTEAVHNGVPMVIMPQFGDQFANARAVELSGGGIMLDFTAITEDIIYDALTKVLTPDFNKKAKELSERFRDRPLPPLETAIYWVEYVARHKGAPHMRTAAVGMPLYQYLLLDVIAFLMVISAIILYVSYVVLKFFLKRLFGRKREDKLKKN